MKNKIEINGKTYVLESSIKTLQNTKQEMPKKKGKLTYCIIRTYSAGVFAGWIDRSNNIKERTIYNSRRLWKWQTAGALDCSSLAEHGVISSGCKFSEVREEIDLTEIIEVQPCTKKSKESIENVAVYNND